MPQQITESSALTELAEASQVKSGRMLVQAISAGLGSSGYYSPAVLEQAAKDRLITRGTPLHLDHASESERTDRPERSVQTIAGVFTGDAAYDPTRNALIGEIQIFSPHRERLSEMAPYIGLSISGSATDVVEGEHEGRKVRIIEGLAAIDSVDFVVRAGRGGQVLTDESAPAEGLLQHLNGTYGPALRESGLAISPVTYSTTTNGIPTTTTLQYQIVPSAPAGQPTTESSKEMNMPNIEEARLRTLEEAEGKVSALEAERDTATARAEKAEAALAEANARDTAHARARESLKESTLPPAAVDRIVSESVRVLSLKDGKLDEAAFDAAVQAAQATEARYLESVAPKGVTGFGASAPADQVAESARPTTNPWGRSLSAVKEA